MDKSDFRAVSKATESCVNSLADMRYHADRGEWAFAYVCLNDIHNAMITSGGVNTIRALREEIAAVSDGVIQHYGPSGKRSYASAHEAVADVCWLAYLALMAPLEKITDADQWRNAAQHLLMGRAENFSVDSSYLRARLCRERAKLLGTKEQPKDETPQESPFTKSEEKILMYLFENAKDCLRQQLDIAVGVNLSRGTVGSALKSLRARKLVHRPEGGRKGDGLTDLGREVANEVAKHPGPASGC